MLTNNHGLKAAIDFSKGKVKGDHMTSLELSKKLAGKVKRETVYFWGRYEKSKLPSPFSTEHWKPEYSEWATHNNELCIFEQFDEAYPAYTLTELLEELPESIYYKGGLYILMVSVFHCDIFYSRHGSGLEIQPDIMVDSIAKLPEAAGELLLWCIEQGYKEVE